ncbi:hypothetical protein An14g04820 [Aspergillus niger]|uniref:Uncharacterized protein n=2 Tax=Aspergillus niger TaxID=5061 RepID=A2R3M5_ASPNC|nr:hypothetical protein An14g04820 [Aspergillus niger]CAK42043.1 hypothetical protein An14g04820 [Aspergillus niger]
MSDFQALKLENLIAYHKVPTEQFVPSGFMTTTNSMSEIRQRGPSSCSNIMSSTKSQVKTCRLATYSEFPEKEANSYNYKVTTDHDAGTSLKIMPATAATYGSAEHHSQFEQLLNVAKVWQLALSWSTDRVHACMPFPVGQLRVQDPLQMRTKHNKLAQSLRSQRDQGIGGISLDIHVGEVPSTFDSRARIGLTDGKGS